MEKTINYIPLPVLLISNDQRIVHANGAASNLLSFREEESCHAALLGRGEACEGCTLAGESSVKKFQARILLKNEAGEAQVLVQCAPAPGGQVVAVLRDISKELGLIKEFSFVKK